MNIPETPRAGPATRVGAQLSELLAQPEYRHKWFRHAERARAGQLNVLAVARFLASRDQYGVTDSSALRDRVRRALNGSLVSAETLRLFISGFGFTQDEARQLWELLDPPTVSGSAVRGALPSRSIGTPSKESVLSLVDEHVLGPDGLPLHHETTQVIQANESPLEHLALYADTGEIAFSVERGGSVERLPSDVPGFPARMCLRYDRPLQPGESTLLRYRFDFAYTEAPTLLFSRVARHPIHNLSIAVTFAPQRLPATVWWRVWGDLEHQSVLHEEQVEPDGVHTVFRHLSSLEDAVAGFAWEW
jgi:hypothetical protein